MSVDLTAWNDALYIHYDNDKLYNLCDLNNPTLMSVEKDTEFPGRHASQGVIYQIGGGGSASISKTITNTQASVPEEFVGITRKKMYEVAILDNDAIEASATDKGGFAKVIDEVDRKFQAASMRVESRLHRGRGGWIGRIASGTPLGATLLTLDDAADAFNFYKGQKIVAASTDGTSGALRNSGATLTVASVQRTAGTVTMTANLSTGIAAIADTDYLFTEGDFGEGILSFYDWCAFDRTSLSTPFFSVVRSDDADRLAGLFYDGTGEPYHETLTRVVGLLGTHIGGGGMDLVAYMHPDVMTEMVLAAQGKMIIDATATLGSSRKVDWGMKTFAVTVGTNRVTLAPTWASRKDRMIVSKPDIWKLKSNGGFPKFLNRTGALHMMENEDSYMSRIGGYGNFFCKAPGWGCAVKLANVRTA